MNETQLILDALQKSAPPKRVRRVKVMREIEPSPIEEGNDAITVLAKKQITKKRAALRLRRKSITEWNNNDFLKYLSEMLSVHGLRLHSAGVQDRDNVGRIYDAMVDRLQENMSNEVLKEYFEWWTSSYGPFLANEPIFSNTFLADHLINKFLSRYEHHARTESKSVEPPMSAVDEYTLYDLGGLPMILASKGLVVTCRVLNERKIDNIFSKISSALRDLSKNAVCQAMEATLKGAPYNESDKVDFISASRRALEFHGLKKYTNISYQDYFQQLC